MDYSVHRNVIHGEQKVSIGFTESSCFWTTPILETETVGTFEAREDHE